MAVLNLALMNLNDEGQSCAVGITYDDTTLAIKAVWAKGTTRHAWQIGCQVGNTTVSGLIDGIVDIQLNASMTRWAVRLGAEGELLVPGVTFIATV